MKFVSGFSSSIKYYTYSVLFQIHKERHVIEEWCKSSQDTHDFLAHIDHLQRVIVFMFVCEISIKLAYVGPYKALGNFWLMWDAFCIYVPVITLEDNIIFGSCPALLSAYVHFSLN